METAADFSQLGTPPRGLALALNLFLAIPVLKPWRLTGVQKMIYPSHPQSAHAGKKEGPSGTRERTTNRISVKAFVSADRQVQTILIEGAPGGRLCRSPRRRPVFLKLSSPTVGGGLGHEISSHPSCFPPLRFLVCSRCTSGTCLGRSPSSSGTAFRAGSLWFGTIIRS